MRRKGAKTGGSTSGSVDRRPPGLSSPEFFARLVRRRIPDGPGVFPLTNFTFFVGAGFSKSWSENYPTGAQLFRVPKDDRVALHNVESVANFPSILPGNDLQMDAIKQLVYTLEMNQRYHTIRSRYVD